MRGLRWLLVILIVAAGGLALAPLIPRDSHQPGRLTAFTLDERPQQDRYLFDYAQIIEHYTEGTERYLRRIAQRFHIEALIVTLPDAGVAHSIQHLAVEIVNRWRIGTDFNGRGLLLLLLDSEKQVKLEVGYELEDVFTDAFTGYVEDLQLKPYFLSRDIGTGLIAVMEELERRAQIKDQGDYTSGMIAKLDQDLLSGGAGSTRQLDSYLGPTPRAAAGPARPGAGALSPEQAWRIMLSKWAGSGTHIETDIYTELTKLAMGDQNHPDPRTKAALGHWQRAAYRILQDGGHAVVYFGNQEGWNNAPFLFCKTTTGWKFDIVHQRRLVVMGPSPTWMIAQGNYPYVNLLSGVPQSTGKDLPLPEEDLYSCALDEELAQQIRALEANLERNSQDFAVVMTLARLNVITGRRPNHVKPLLARARRLEPNSAEPDKYSAIYNVNVLLQYETALKDIESYIGKRPDDVFGYNFKGFIHHRLGRYRRSIEVLDEAIEMNPDNVYAYALLARNYALLHEQSNKLDPRRRSYRASALAMLRGAEAAPTRDHRRVARLTSWLKRRQVL